MTTDDELVERLRFAETFCGPLSDVSHLFAEAADRISLLREALEFYADRDFDGYDVRVGEDDLSVDEGHIIQDGGERARQALASSGGGG